MEKSITIFIEQLGDHEFMAYSDEIQCLATGSTAKEVVTNFRTALNDLIHHYGDEVLQDFSKKTTMKISLV